MKYPNPKEYKSLKTSSFPIKDFMYGINDDTGETASKGDLLRDCVNMEYRDNLLVTRKGFRANENSVVYPADYSAIAYLPFTVTDSVYFENGVPKNLAYCCTGSFDSATLSFYLTDSSGNISPKGSIQFSRSDSTHFYSLPGAQ